MLNIIWPLFIIGSFIYAILTGRIEEVNTSIFDSTASAVTLTLTLIRYYVLMEWNYEDCY